MQAERARVGLVFGLLVCLSGGAAWAQDLASVAAGADSVVLGTVSSVESLEVPNEHGDQLIVSRVTLTVDEVFVGPAADTVTLYVEGGTLGDITLHVSDLPMLEPADRGVFLIWQTASGFFVPYKRGRGILKLDSDDFVEGTNLSLSEIRSQFPRP